MAKKKTELLNTEVRRQETSSETTTDKKESNSLDVEIQEQIAADSKAFKKRFKGYEPYDLAEIEGIIQKAEKAANKTNNYDEKKSFLNEALDAVSLRIRNSEVVYNILEQEGSIDDPDNFETFLIQANISKEKLEHKIRYLRPTDVEESDNFPEANKLDEDNVKASISEQIETRENMNIKQVAEYTGLSVSLINQLQPNPNEAIPCARINSRRVYRREDVDKWLIKRVNRYSSKITRFTFRNNIHEKFLDSFVHNGYLDKTGASIMKERFSEVPNKEKRKILWKKDLRSLMTFVYLSDRLDFIDKSKPGTTRPHNTGEGEIKEIDNNKKEVQYQTLLNNNFFIDGQSFDETRFPTAWQDINAAICELRRQIAENVTKNKKITAAEAKKLFSRKEAIEKYFRETFDIYNEMTSDETKKRHFYGCIDDGMLKIVQEVWLLTNK